MKEEEMGIKFNRMKNFFVTGTTSANANEAMRTKKENPWRTNYVLPFGFCQKGVYVSNPDREGFQFATDEEEILDNSDTEIAPTSIKSANLGGGKVVLAAINGAGNLVVRGGIIGVNKQVSWGDWKDAFSDDCASISLSPTLEEGVFLLSWLDVNGGYTCYVRSGSVDGDGVVTLGNSKDVSNGGCSNYGTSILCCGPNLGVVTFCKESTGRGSVVAFQVNSLIIGDTSEEKGDVVEAVYYPSAARYNEGEFFLGYQAPDTENDPLSGVTIEVGTDLVVEVGLIERFSDSANAATSINVVSDGAGSVVVGWIDDSDPHLLALTIVGGSITRGDILALTINNAAYLSIGLLSSKEVAVSFENTTKSNYLYTNRVTRVGTTLTAGSYFDPGVEAESIYGNLLVLSSKEIMLFFADAANSNYLTQQFGQFKEHLIDVRSSSASIEFAGYILSKRKDSFGILSAKKITGTTHASADTQMATMPTLPWNKVLDVLVVFKDRGMYVENSSTTAIKNGVSRANRTIDVRSTSTAIAFEAYVLKVVTNIQSFSVAQA
jgi:hypothetical protein